MKLKEGREFRNSIANTPLLFLDEKEFESAKLKLANWVQYVKDLLEVLFYNGSAVEQFAPNRGGYVEIGGVPTYREQVAEFLKSADAYLHRLESILGRLDLAHEGEAKPTGLIGPVTQSSTVFISHSSKDEDAIRVVRHAFDELDLTPLFNEGHPAGGPPVETLVERIANSKAVFVFFTLNSIFGATRDWIIFELGAAQALGKPIFAWVQNAVGKDSLPKLLEQLTIYRPFEVMTNKGTIELVNEVRQAVRGLL